ncbi:MAG: hypothetical protein AAGK79_06420 [Pseudomonadota bacterium]
MKRLVPNTFEDFALGDVFEAACFAFERAFRGLVCAVWKQGGSFGKSCKNLGFL